MQFKLIAHKQYDSNNKFHKWYTLQPKNQNKTHNDPNI